MCYGVIIYSLLALVMLTHLRLPTVIVTFIRYCYAQKAIMSRKYHFSVYLKIKHLYAILLMCIYVIVNN